MQTALVELKGVSKIWRSVAAVQDVNLRIYRGEIFALLGPNGAGKSTLLGMIAGLIRPTAGEIILHPDVQRRGMAGFIGDPPIYPHLSGRENLFMAYYHRGLPVDVGRVEEVLHQVGLDHAADRQAGAYSTGMRQRLGIARALLFPVPFVILDEPTNGLDPEGIVHIRELILHLTREHGYTWLITSHILSEVQRLASRVGIMVGGRLRVVMHLGDAEEVGRVYTVLSPDVDALLGHLPSWAQPVEVTEESITVRLQNAHTSADLNTALVRRGIRVQALMPAFSRLELAYLRALDLSAEEKTPLKEETHVSSRNP